LVEDGEESITEDIRPILKKKDILIKNYSNG